MLSAIAKPFGWLMLVLYNFFNDYGIAIFAFALIVRLILLPFSIVMGSDNRAIEVPPFLVFLIIIKIALQCKTPVACGKRGAKRAECVGIPNS